MRINSNFENIMVLPQNNQIEQPAQLQKGSMPVQMPIQPSTNSNLSAFLRRAENNIGASMIANQLRNFGNTNSLSNMLQNLNGILSKPSSLSSTTNSTSVSGNQSSGCQSSGDADQAPAGSLLERARN